MTEDLNYETLRKERHSPFENRPVCRRCGGPLVRSRGGWWVHAERGVPCTMPTFDVAEVTKEE